MKRTIQFHASNTVRQLSASGCHVTSSMPDGPLGLQRPEDSDTVIETLVVRVRDLAGDELAELQHVPESKTCRDVLRELMIQVSSPEGTVYNLVSENTMVNHHSPISQYRNGTSNVIEFIAISQQHLSFEELANARDFAESITKRDLAEMRNFISPPPNVAMVLGAVCRVLDKHHSGRWKDILITLKKPSFIHDLMNFVPGLNTRRILETLDPYIADDKFRPEVMKYSSLAGSTLCAWCLAIHAFCRGAEGAQ